jgi:hydroxyacylglutathione hydrolase
VIVTSTTVGEVAENAYLVVDEATREAVYVDPGAEGGRLLDILRKSGATLTGIWLTHAHFDHIGGIGALRAAYPDVPIYLHPLDRFLYDNGAAISEMYGLPFEVPPPPDRELAEGQRLRIGATEFEVAHVPGHAPGHVAFLGDGKVFGGDLLFAGSIGRTDLPLADPEQMTESLARAATWDPRMVVYPGHGPATTIGHELRTNGFLSGLARPIAR